ncbi:hypothetical protein DFJ74DRAFT_682383 [Hyaloraphidium curvatum]|nr:hypothetical protein DFJ74DRAFT_682383 [Hyaloraphidium curvatum]
MAVTMASDPTALPPHLALVLAGAKRGWSWAFDRTDEPPDTSWAHPTRVAFARRVSEALGGRSAEFYVGLFPPDPKELAGRVTRAYHVISARTPRLEELLSFWDSFCRVGAGNNPPASLDAVLNEHMAEVLGYPVGWRPSRPLGRDQRGGVRYRDMQLFVWLRGADPVGWAPDEEGLESEDPVLVESYGFLEGEREAVLEDGERRVCAYGAVLEGLGLGKVEMEIVDLRGGR